MNDSEVREIVLRVFYEKRAENFTPINEKNFGDQFPISEIYRICSQLEDLKYIDLKAHYAANKIYSAWGKISVSGTDYVEQMRSETEKSDSVLKNSDIYKLVNQYIGVSGGYLGDFSYSTHYDFYPEYCDLSFDTYEMDGTTREKFIKILQDEGSRNQAKIIRGVLAKYPVSSFPEDEQEQKEKLFQHFQGIAQRLESGSPIATPTIAQPIEIVEHAIADAEVLLKERGANSSVDRIHTALHGYTKSVCSEAGHTFDESDSLTKLFSTIYSDHPAFDDISHSGQIRTILRSQAGAINTINTIRNNATPAHPNTLLLEEPEAQFCINIAKSLIQYIEGRLASWRSGS